MKVILHVPVEQYGFVAVELDFADGKMTPEDVAEQYSLISKAFQPKPLNSLSDKEYNLFIDRMLNNEAGNHIEQYEKMSPLQTYAVQVIKRGIKRLEAKSN